MGRFLKLTSYMLIAAIFSVALSGCTKKTTTETSNTIKVWSFESEDAWTPIKEDFEANNEGYTLVYEKQTLDGNYENRVLNSILSGNGPDVWSMPNDWVYRHKDKLVPRPKEDPAVDLDNIFVSSVKQSLSFDDNIYALTPSAQPLVVFYNEEYLNNAIREYDASHPSEENEELREKFHNLYKDGFMQTWTDFAQFINLTTKKDGEKLTRPMAALGSDKLTYSPEILYLLMMQNGTRFLSDDKNLAMLNLPEETPKQTAIIPGKEALTFFTSFADPKSPNYTWNNSFGNDVDAFANGKVGIIFGFDELQSVFAQKYPNFSYEKAAVPQLNTEPEKFVDYAKFNAFGVSNLSPNPEISWSLVDSLTGDYNSDFIAASRLNTSLKSEAVKITMSERMTNNPDQISLATAKSLVKGKFPIEFDNMIRDMVLAINLGVQDPQSALDLVATNITSELLRKESW
jgi:ABC-type glycerol-3-phosphate transport system substrate-binding protein